MTSRTAAVASLALAAAILASAARATSSSAPPPASFPSPLNLNCATEADLDLLPSVGPRSAARIVADRHARGPFPTPRDLRRVPGLTRRTIDRVTRLAVAR